jgi:hypothetical protein
MSAIEKPTLKKVYWQDIRKTVAQVNTGFAHLVDALSPDNRFPLYIAQYPYGTLIVENGKFFLPTEEGGLRPVLDKDTDPQIREDLSYAMEHIPCSMMLENSVEQFIDAGTHVTPAFMHTPGKIFGLWKELDIKPSFYPENLFSMSSGARSIFMIPNIGDIYYHKNLKRDFDLRLPPPKNLTDQWNVFKKITQHPNANCQWHSTILFFSKSWLHHLTTDTAWSQLYALLLKKLWEFSSYWRNKVLYDYTFSCAQANRNLKPNPYLADSVKHLIQIALGAALGFNPKQDNVSAPIELLQKIYIESYHLKKYIPTIMAPSYFSARDPIVYYSLQFPSTLEFSPKARKLTSTVADLSEMKHIATIYFNEILSGRLKIENTAMAKVIEEVQLTFFQSKQDRHGEVQLTDQMPLEDPKLIECNYLNQHSPQQQREFSDTGTFNRGCVRITRKKKGTI